MLHLLVNGLEELPLMLPDFGMVNLLQQFGVFVNEPCFPQDVGSGIFDLQAGSRESRALALRTSEEPKGLTSSPASLFRQQRSATRRVLLGSP